MIKCQNECPKHKFDGCCQECPDKETCENVCKSSPDDCVDAVLEESKELQPFEAKELKALQRVAKIVEMKAKLDDEEKELKDKLKASMEEFGIKKFESKTLNITYVDETTRESFDSKKFKEEHPEESKKYLKTSKVSSCIKIKLK